MSGEQVRLGRIGVWTWAFDQNPWARVREAVAEIEELGYGTIWFGEGLGRPAPTQAALLLEATRRMVVAPGVANIYRHDPVTLAQSERALAEAFPGRFVLGLGVGAKIGAEAKGKPWGAPVGSMRGYLDAMDEAASAQLTGPAPAAPSPRVLAALGPKMLRLAGQRSWGAHPFFLPVEHTAYARDILGPHALLAVHQSVTLHPDRHRARQIARIGVSAFIQNMHIVPSRWTRIRELLGFDDSDLTDGGSQRLIDALVATGDTDAIAARVRQQFDAGADHVCISMQTDSPTPQLALDELRQLAAALLSP